MTISIIPYHPSFQAGIDLLVEAIQNEFKEPISTPASKNIHELAMKENERYWVALHDKDVIGTIGIAMLPGNNAVLKFMMVEKSFRGEFSGVSGKLLDTAIKWAADSRIKNIYLGTMAQFNAAQRFYEKHGFEMIPPALLPEEFPENPVDTVFYRRKLALLRFSTRKVMFTF